MTTKITIIIITIVIITIIISDNIFRESECVWKEDFKYGTISHEKW